MDNFPSIQMQNLEIMVGTSQSRRRYRFWCVLTTLLTISNPFVLATDHVVGDDKGWTFGFNYTVWAQEKQFIVGDKLIFNYPPGLHDVYRVNGTIFKQCTPPVESRPLTTGNDVVLLSSPGKAWFICGVGLHCENGQKLVITVMDQSNATAPIFPPPPPSIPSEPTPSPKSPRLPPVTESESPPPGVTILPPPSGATITRAFVSVSGHLGFMAMVFGILFIT